MHLNGAASEPAKLHKVHVFYVTDQKSQSNLIYDCTVFSCHFFPLIIETAKTVLNCRSVNSEKKSDAPDGPKKQLYSKNCKKL